MGLHGRRANGGRTRRLLSEKNVGADSFLKKEKSDGFLAGFLKNGLIWNCHRLVVPPFFPFKTFSTDSIVCLIWSDLIVRRYYLYSELKNFFFQVAANSVKYSIKITNWPFQSFFNYLEILSTEAYSTSNSEENVTIIGEISNFRGIYVEFEGFSLYPNLALFLKVVLFCLYFTCFCLLFV